MIRSYFDKPVARRNEFNNDSNYYYYQDYLDGRRLSLSLYLSLSHSLSLSLSDWENKMVLKIIYQAATTNQRNVYGQKIK